MIMNKNKILSKERQDALTPMDAFNLMVEGNKRYIDAQSEGIDLSSSEMTLSTDKTPIQLFYLVLIQELW